MSDSAHRIQVKVSEAGVEPVFFEASGVAVTIGRSKDCDVVLEQSYVSGRHLTLHFGVLAEDLGSSNGTFIGGLALDGPTLIAGRTLTLGGHDLAVEVRVLDGSSAMGKLGAQIQRMMEQSVPAASDGPKAAVEPVPEFELAGDDSALLAGLVKLDVEGMAPLGEMGEVGATDAFIYEAFAFIRNAERIIATVAGDVTRRPAMQTRMPGSEDNFRGVMGALFASGGSAEGRRGVEEYLTKVLDWLFASVSAYQSAAIAVVKELQGEMRASSLMGEGQVPLHTRWLRREKVALWERAQERLEEWTASHIVERLEDRARGEAAKHMGQETWRDGRG